MQPLSASQREAMEEAATSYHLEAQLTGAADEWLAARGIDAELAATFRLGVVADPFPGHERFRGWLAIPYLDKDGKALSMRFRCLSEHQHRDFSHGKYMSIKDEPSRVYNVGDIHRAGDEIHVSEGEFDAMVLHKVFGYACGFPGAQGWSAHHRRLLAGFSRIYVWGDPDDAGAEFTQKVTRSLRQAKGVRLRTGDVSDTYRAGGADALRSLLDGEL